MENVPDMYILDVVADDWEELENIVHNLNREPEGGSVPGWHMVYGRHFAVEEVVASLEKMIARGWIEVAVDDENEPVIRGLAPGELLDDLSTAWFHISPRGRLVHQEWDPVTPWED